MKEVRDIIGFWEAHREQVLALATLVNARGSSFRQPGARMVINPAGESAGGLSAGCIEEEVIACGRRVLHTAAPELLTFDTRARFGCHGAIDILVEPLRDEVMAELRDCVMRRESCRLQTELRAPERGTRIAREETVPGAFVQVVEPPLRLILIGDNSETQTLRTLARVLGWDLVELPGAPVPPEILDDRTAVILATHNFGRDCAALRDLAPAGLRYLGLVGSRRRRDDILFDVMHEEAVIDSNLFAPAGLHLGAETPEEIALSIAAEIQSVFGGGTAQQLRSRKAPIHQRAPNQAIACEESVA